MSIQNICSFFFDKTKISVLKIQKKRYFHKQRTPEDASTPKSICDYVYLWSDVQIEINPCKSFL